MDKSMPSLSLTDFLSYIFPGLIMLLGLLVLAIQTLPSSSWLMDPDSISWGVGLLSIPVSYYLGMISSGLLRLARIDGTSLGSNGEVDKPLSNPMLEEHQERIKTAYRRYFGANTTWSRQTYYAMRAVVREYAPRSAEYANRQIALRHMRRNSILPSIIWAIVGLTYGIRVACGRDWILGVAFIGLSTFMGGLVVYAFIRGSRNNRLHEVRDNCLAFMILIHNSSGNIEHPNSLERETG